MLKYKCLVLDHDDTLVQTERAMGYPYFREYIRSIRPGEDFTFAEYLRDCNNTIFEDMCRSRWKMTEAELTEEYLGWKEYSRRNIPPLCPGMDAVVRRQKEAGGLVCVASLSTKEIIERDFLHHFGFLPDAVYDNDLPRHLRKPNPYALEDIMTRFSLKPEELLMVDDMKMGHLMAKSAGVASAFAGWSKAEFPELTHEMRSLCDYSFASAGELEAFLFEEK